MSALVNGVNNILSRVAQTIWCDATYYRVERSGVSIGDASQTTTQAFACKALINEGRSGHRADSGVRTINRTVCIAVASLPTGHEIKTGDQVEIAYPLGGAERLDLTGVTSRDPAGVYWECEIVQ